MVLLMSEPASSQLRAGEEAKSVLQEGQDLEGRTLPAQNLSGFNWIFFPMHNKNSFVCSKDGIWNVIHSPEVVEELVIN